MEVLKKKPQSLIEVFTSKKGDEEPLFNRIREEGIPLKILSKKELSNLVDSESHQGFAARVKRDLHIDLQTFFRSQREKESGLVVMIDSIFDPQNLGTILRASECFGADAVVWSKNRGAPITPTVAKASVGATELISRIVVSNLVDTIKKFQEHDFWAVTTEISRNAENLYTFDFPAKTLLIVGSEGEGVRPLVSKQSDFHLYIPMLGKIDSLNVSQAASVVLSHYRRLYSFEHGTNT